MFGFGPWLDRRKRDFAKTERLEPFVYDLLDGGYDKSARPSNPLSSHSYIPSNWKRWRWFTREFLLKK